MLIITRCNSRVILFFSLTLVLFVVKAKNPAGLIGIGFNEREDVC